MFAELPIALLLAGRWTVPVLLVPPILATRLFAQRAIDVPDVVDDGGPIRVRVDHVATLGNLASVPDGAFAFVSGGHVVATVAASAGEGELPAGLDVGSLGVYRVGRDAPAEPLAAIEEWAPGLGLVHTHVHAKVVSSDGVRCAVGSANLDITASYWESELLLVVEDAALTRAFEAEIDLLMAGSIPMKSNDPAWQLLANRRAWMRHWPGVLSV